MLGAAPSDLDPHCRFPVAEQWWLGQPSEARKFFRTARPILEPRVTPADSEPYVEEGTYTEAYTRDDELASQRASGDLVTHDVADTPVDDNTWQVNGYWFGRHR